jgi:adenylate cyclase
MKQRFPLTLHISTLFLFVTGIVAMTIGLLAFNATDKILRDGAQEKVDHIAIQTTAHLRNLVASPELSVKLLSNSTITEATSLRERMKYLALFRGALLDNEQVAAIYVGYANGDFFLLRPLHSEIERNKYNAPADTQFMVQSIEHQGNTLEGSYIFLDSALRELKVERRPEYPKRYFPVKRPWYQSAIQYSGVVITPPYLFFANQKVGITIARQSDNRRAVVATDIQMDGLSARLAEQKPTSGSKLAMIDERGVVIATGDPVSLVSEPIAGGAETQLKQLNELNTPVLTRIFEIISKQDNTTPLDKLIRLDKEDWEIDVHPFPVGGEGHYRLITAVPDKELLADAIRLRNNLVQAIIVLLILILPIVLLISKSISKPITLMAQVADNIRELSLDPSPQIHSRVKEISILNHALHRLQVTISAFSSYIPRDLVIKLLKTDDGIQIGGESRFLTILFSDLKDFSTLSETTPSRELLVRVSSYLELMTLAIKEEHGTVDKFIGDSVMAFWGAPNLEPNHAYHSAVAAMKTKRRMVGLNEALAREGKPPLVARIGINSDSVLVGNIGSAERLSYTVMGDGVNIASRLEGINKEFGTDITLSHAVFKEAGERLFVRPIDKITVKGRAGEILIYELLGIRDAGPETAPSKIEEALCSLTTTAFQFYSHHQYESALAIYEEMVSLYHDELSKVMANRCRDALTEKSVMTS